MTTCAMRWGETVRWAALLMMLTVLFGTRALAAQPPLTPPGETVTVAPGQAVVFAHPVMRAPGATRGIEVTNWGEVSGTAVSDGRIITIALPSGSTVDARVIYEGLYASVDPCPLEPGEPHVARCAPLEHRATGASVRFRAIPARAATEELVLVAGCNNVSLTWADGTATTLVASAILPRSRLEAIWRLDAGRDRFVAWSPIPNAPSDLLDVRRPDAVFICMRGSGILTRPAW